jgi:hypothetical protein
MHRRDLLRAGGLTFAAGATVGLAGCTDDSGGGGDDSAFEDALEGDESDGNGDDESNGDDQDRDGDDQDDANAETADEPTDTDTSGETRTETADDSFRDESTPTPRPEGLTGSVGNNAVSGLTVVDHSASKGDGLRVSITVENTGDQVMEPQYYSYDITAIYEDGSTMEAPFTSQQGGEGDVQPGERGSITVDAAVRDPGSVVRYRISVNCGTSTLGVYCED